MLKLSLCICSLPGVSLQSSHTQIKEVDEGSGQNLDLYSHLIAAVHAGLNGDIKHNTFRQACAAPINSKWCSVGSLIVIEYSSN